ncbi:MAG: DUF4124 domain-containing protein [Pseudomonadota bacterium]
MRKIIQILVVVSFSLMAEAAVYKWTDEHGQTHFSDHPLDQESEQVQIAPSQKAGILPPSQAERDEKRQRLLEVYREDRSKKQAAAAKQKQKKTEKKQKCRQAKKRYAKFNNAGGLYTGGESGEKRYLEHAERARFIARLQAEIDHWCGNNTHHE